MDIDKIQEKAILLFSACSIVALILVFCGTFETAYSQPVPPLMPSVVSSNSSIPSTNYGYIGDTYIGRQINPLEVSTTAYDNYSFYLKTHDEKAKQIFLNSANWLVSNAVHFGNYSILEYRFPWPEYNLKAPWQSGMTQALAMKTLIKANQVTGDIRYLDAAKKLLNSFFVEVKSGGVTYKTSNDGWWYEEYAGIGGKEPRVLNGMMYTVLALNDYYKYTNDSSAKFLFDEGILGLMKNLPRYDYPQYSYSYYDSLKTTNPLFYHNVHIKLLGQLYSIIKEPIFRQYQARWMNYEKPPFLAR